MGKKDTALKITVLLSYIVMVIITVISFVVKVNGRTVMETIASYPNLFAPSRYAFFVLSLSNILLLAFSIYQLGIFKKKHNNEKEILHDSRIACLTINVLNISWLIAWHYDYLALSVLILFGIVMTLRVYGLLLKNETLTFKEKVLLGLPFNLLFAWTTLLAVTNTFILLDSLRWEGFGFSKTMWVIVVMILITLLAVKQILHNKNLVYGITFLWVYVAILVRQVSKSELHSEYPFIILTTICGIIILIGANGALLVKSMKKE